MIVTVKVQIVRVIRLINSRIYRGGIVRVLSDDGQNATIRVESETGATFLRFTLRTVPRLIRFRHQEAIECVVVDHQLLLASYSDHVFQLDFCFRRAGRKRGKTLIRMGDDDVDVLILDLSIQ